MQIHSLFFLGCLLASCSAPSVHNKPVPETAILTRTIAIDTPISDYVVAIFEDSKGNKWFGTMSDGVARYDGQTLRYFNTTHGLVGNTVASIAEDKNGIMWFGSHSGLSKYDGTRFTNYTTLDGLCHERVSELLVDKKGILWVGTWGGVCQFNGISFSNFPIPIPDVKMNAYQTTSDWVTEIMEDHYGNIWIGRDGYGACKFDGTQFTHFTKKEGLASNNVQVIREDPLGNIWLGSRISENDHPDPDKRAGDGGLSCYDGKQMRQFPGIKGLHHNETYAIGVGKNGHIWIGANLLGLYRYDGQNFTLFSHTDSSNRMPYGFGIQHILEDKDGVIWLGLSGGLFRLRDTTIQHIGQEGPWY